MLHHVVGLALLKFLRALKLVMLSMRAGQNIARWPIEMKQTARLNLFLCTCSEIRHSESSPGCRKRTLHLCRLCHPPPAPNLHGLWSRNRPLRRVRPAPMVDYGSGQGVLHKDLIKKQNKILFSRGCHPNIFTSGFSVVMGQAPTIQPVLIEIWSQRPIPGM